MSTTQQEQIPHLNIGNIAFICILTICAIITPYVIVNNINKVPNPQSQPSAIKTEIEQKENSNSEDNNVPIVINPDQTMRVTLTDALTASGINNVRVAVADGTVILTGNASRTDLPKIMHIVSTFNPKKIINKLILSSTNNSQEETFTQQPIDYSTKVETAVSNAIAACENGNWDDAYKYYTEAASYPTDRSNQIKQTAANKFYEKAKGFIDRNGECDDFARKLLRYANNLYSSSEIRNLLNRCGGGTTGSVTSNSGRFPQTSERILSSSDLSGLSKYDLKIMRNEIFARHGYIFTTSDMKQYFSNQSWYSPRYSNVTSMLTDIEQKNIAYIKRYE